MGSRCQVWCLATAVPRWPGPALQEEVSPLGREGRGRGGREGDSTKLLFFSLFSPPSASNPPLSVSSSPPLPRARLSCMTRNTPLFSAPFLLLLQRGRWGGRGEEVRARPHFFLALPSPQTPPQPGCFLLNAAFWGETRPHASCAAAAGDPPAAAGDPPREGGCVPGRFGARNGENHPPVWGNLPSLQRRLRIAIGSTASGMQSSDRSRAVGAGSGVSAAADPKAKGSGPRQQQEGEGRGLATCRRLAQELGGSEFARMEPGEPRCRWG